MTPKCPPLTITFLGTGTSSGVPMIACDCEVCTSQSPLDSRLRSSIMVRSTTTTIIVDTTPDFRYQMLRENVCQVDAVLFTHPHKDHIAGLDDIRAFNYFQQSAIDVYANEITQKALKQEFHYIFADDKYPGIPDINLKTITDAPFLVGDIPVVPIMVMHLRMPVLAFRFGNFTYVTDANFIADNEKKKIAGTKILTINALRNEKHISHFTLQEALDLCEELKVDKAYFTHISHQLGLHNKVQNKLPHNRFLAYDRLKINC